MSSAEAAHVAGLHLNGVHAYNLRDHIDHPVEEYDILFRADGTALLVIRIWIDRAPPFRHKVFTLLLEFENGFCISSHVASMKEWG